MLDLLSRLAGKLEFVSDHEQFKEPIRWDETLKLIFRNDRNTVDASQLTDSGEIVTPPFDVDLPVVGKVQNVLTITCHSKGNAGKFTTTGPERGALELPIELKFDHSLPFVGSSLLLLHFTTEQSTLGNFDLVGRRVLATGGTTTVKLVATGTFVGGALDGRRCAISIDGVLSADPFPS